MLHGVQTNERGCTLFLHIPNYMQQFPIRHSTAYIASRVLLVTAVKYSTLHCVKVQRDVFAFNHVALINWVGIICRYSVFFLPVAIAFLCRQPSTLQPSVVYSPGHLLIIFLVYSVHRITFNDGKSCCHVSPLSTILVSCFVSCIRIVSRICGRVSTEAASSSASIAARCRIARTARCPPTSG